MPRTGPARTIQADQNVARWVKLLRETEKWSYEGVARRMTERGCPMQGSTVYKIERQKPPRRISADELAAFVLVFEHTGYTATDLMRSPETAEDERLRDLLRQADEVRGRAEAAMLEWLRIQRVVGVHLQRSERGTEDGRLAAATAEVGAPELEKVGWPLGTRSMTEDGQIEEWDANDPELASSVTVLYARERPKDTDGDFSPATDLEEVRRWLTQ